jgi:hypothetical protein
MRADDRSLLESGGIRAALDGEPAKLLQLGEPQNAKTRTSFDVRVSLVAGKCNHLKLLLGARI